MIAKLNFGGKSVALPCHITISTTPERPKKQYIAAWLWLFRCSGTKLPFLSIKIQEPSKKSSPITPVTAKRTLIMGSSGIFERVFPGQGYQTTGEFECDFNRVFEEPLERSSPRVGWVEEFLRACKSVPRNHQIDNKRNIAPGTAWPTKSPIIFKTIQFWWELLLRLLQHMWNHKLMSSVADDMPMHWNCQLNSAGIIPISSHSETHTKEWWCRNTVTHHLYNSTSVVIGCNQTANHNFIALTWHFNKRKMQRNPGRVS